MDASLRPQDPNTPAAHPAALACTCHIRRPNRYRVNKPAGGTLTGARPWTCQDITDPIPSGVATFPTVDAAYAHVEKLALNHSLDLINTTLSTWTSWVEERHAGHGPDDVPASAMGLCIDALTGALELNRNAQGDRAAIDGLARVLADHPRIGMRSPRCGGCTWRPGREGVEGHIAHQGAMVLIHVLHTDNVALLA